MKVIFLDIDGVLNTRKTFIDIHNEWEKTGIRRVEIDEFRLVYLKRIIDETNALVVLSSTWRTFFKKEKGVIIPNYNKGEQLQVLFKKYGIEIFDITPIDKNRIRQNEIKSWLSNNEVESFVIIDDDSYDLKDFIDKELIKTSFTTKDEMVKDMNDTLGLCEVHIHQILAILNNEIKTKKHLK